MSITFLLGVKQSNLKTMSILSLGKASTLFKQSQGKITLKSLTKNALN